jgi:hypothetical protein
LMEPFHKKALKLKTLVPFVWKHKD